MTGIRPARQVFAAVFSLSSLWLLCAGVGSSEAGSLAIRPVVQPTDAWCWAAVGEMVFGYFDVPNVNPAGHYQCGIVGLLAAGAKGQACASRCDLCPMPAANAATILAMIRDYPRKVAEATGEPVTGLRAVYQSQPLTAPDLMAAIDRRSPVIAAVSPSGWPSSLAGSRHVALVVGYQEKGGLLEIKVNDPFPFSGWADNPYVRAGGRPARGGGYWIEYGAFWQWLNWRESFVIERAESIRSDTGRNCCTRQRKCGPFLKRPAQPIGMPCSCQSGEPYPSGRVCR